MQSALDAAGPAPARIGAPWWVMLGIATAVFVVPTLGLNPTQARNAAAYLLTFGAGDDRPRHPLPASGRRALRWH